MTNISFKYLYFQYSQLKQVIITLEVKQSQLLEDEKFLKQQLTDADQHFLMLINNPLPEPHPSKPRILSKDLIKRQKYKEKTKRLLILFKKAISNKAYLDMEHRLQIEQLSLQLELLLASHL
ncbi:hypothetical protein [Photobacterium angustum]|uniref:hypothetical protein n=1 Tax=Photobacterium angustum TaxID=661 RepID=UPI0005DB56DD|nr:hypothetical protein [Photobacterium angustum]KJG03341.1 hypothetical protein UB35_00605 [Photobacterium angustum]PSV68236.1 hypothetical protein CTM95_06010 [Photobacterium angustum]